MTETEQAPCRAGAIRPNSHKIKQMRLEKGWSQLELAGQAGCSKRTVESIETGNCCYLFTIQGFAKAFGVKPSLLQLGTTKSEESGPGRFEMTFTLSVSYETFDQSEDLINFVSALKNLAASHHPMMPVKVNVGSTIVTMAMDQDTMFEILNRLYTPLPPELSSVTEISLIGWPYHLQRLQWLIEGMREFNQTFAFGDPILDNGLVIVRKPANQQFRIA